MKRESMMRPSSSRVRTYLLLAAAATFIIGCKSKPDPRTDTPPPQSSEAEAAMPIEFSPAPDQWDFYPSKINDSMASVMVNLWFGEHAPMSDFGHLLWVFIQMESPGAQGVGLAEEADATGLIEDALSAHLETALEAHYVGRIRGEGSWQLYFYGRGADGFGEAVDGFMATYPDREYSVGNKADPDWQVFKTIIFPDDERLAWIDDRHVVEALMEHGDPLTEPRRVDHWIYFDDAAARDRFEVAAGKLGFETQQGDGPRSDDGQLGLQIHREDHVDLERIHAVVMELRTLAAEHGGNYDGWETVVLAPPRN